MARKRPLPKYAGALAEPIYVDTVSGEPDEWIKAQVFEKMALLFTHYEIDSQRRAILAKIGDQVGVRARPWTASCVPNETRSQTDMEDGTRR